MSEEQLSALLAKLKEDAGLQEKLKEAADLDAAVVLAKEAGFDVSKEDWLKYQAKQTLELSDAELEAVAGGYCSGANKQSASGCECPSIGFCTGQPV
jgi:predicted ribosomally synthesized peptide with nif11-like leader